MLNPTEIYDNIESLAARRPTGGRFGVELMEAVGSPKVAVTRIRDEALAKGSFVWTRMLQFETAPAGSAGTTLDRMIEESSGRPKAKRSRILVAYDGETIAAYDTRIGDDLRLGIDALSYEADFFFPLSGRERYVPAKERQADVRATKHLSRFFDAVRDANPGWNTDADRLVLNEFMARILFCLFSDDVGIFPEKDLFERAVVTSTNVDGSDLADFLRDAFLHMNTSPEKRSGATRGWSKLPYVNGGLFEKTIPVPTLDSRCRRHLLDCARLNWRDINPDIFGSMLQGVVDVSLRGELGMHYTSPANIEKVFGPILLDELKAQLEACGRNKGKLREFLTRLGKVRVFDPACGSGNFLIIAYKELRKLEMEAFGRLGELPHDVVALHNFHGIEIDDFACQTARLGLWIAQYQMDEVFRTTLGRNRPFLPLGEAGRITCGNAARVDWLSEKGCPAAPGYETVVIGNPPFKGATWQTRAQKDDMEHVFKGELRTWGELDYVAIWFMKGALYAEATGAKVAFVSTNSIVQGVQVSALWPRLLKDLQIQFAHRSFKWSNLARQNAGVSCVIVGLGRDGADPKRLYDAGTVREVLSIGPYLAPNTTVIVEKERSPLSSLQPMLFGNKPTDGGHLMLDKREREEILAAHPEAERFVRRLYGSQELMKGLERWCIWVRPDEVDAASRIPPLKERLDKVQSFRLASPKAATRKSASVSWSFESQYEAQSHSIMIPRVSSESRAWLPVEVMDATAIVQDRLFAIYDGEIWQAGVLSSRMHRLWLDLVGGKLEDRLSYSNQLVWNTFPLPDLSDYRKGELEEHWWEIHRCRKEAGVGKSLGELYDPKRMPADLREAHEALDVTMERIFGSRKYRSDADRVEHLLLLYEAAVSGSAGKARKTR